MLLHFDCKSVTRTPSRCDVLHFEIKSVTRTPARAEFCNFSLTSVAKNPPRQAFERFWRRHVFTRAQQGAWSRGEMFEHDLNINQRKSLSLFIVPLSTSPIELEVAILSVVYPPSILSLSVYLLSHILNVSRLNRSFISAINRNISLAIQSVVDRIDRRKCQPPWPIWRSLSSWAPNPTPKWWSTWMRRVLWS